ncbi:hypothetical protein [Sinomicrobium soli]|uniref:hypothetical protein n=1 Tax=Sinomicrobium sp. N-1-3-6 TaxID=2219864 RepID=UPI0011BD8C62|nr:hypothetical protein [Sinomicrobium sp. N-1-3-6]
MIAKVTFLWQQTGLLFKNIGMRVGEGRFEGRADIQVLYGVKNTKGYLKREPPVCMVNTL